MRVQQRHGVVYRECESELGLAHCFCRLSYRAKLVNLLLLQSVVYVCVFAHAWLWVPGQQRLTSANACHLTAHEVLYVMRDQGQRFTAH